MKLLDLSIVRMPGIERPIRIQSLDDTFNIILGANASGKSSMCRAAQALLWVNAIPKDSYWEVHSHWSQKNPSISGQTEDSDERANIEIRIKGQEHQVLQFGTEREALNVPSEALRACYLITLEDLFVSDGSDLAAMMANEMAGGFNIHAVKDKPPVRAKRVHHESKQLKLAQSNFRKIDAQQKSLKQSEVKLAQLKDDIEKLQAKANLKDSIQQAIELYRLTQEDEVRTQRLSSFPKGLESLYGNELSELDELQQELKRLEKNALDYERQIEEAKLQIAEQSLPEDGVSDSEMEVLRTLISSLSPVDHAVTQQKQKIRKCEQALSIDALADSADLLNGQDPRPELLQRLSAQAYALEEASSREARLSAEFSLLERRLDANPLGDFSSTDYENALNLLNEVIEQHQELIRNRISTVTVISFLLLCVLALAGGHFVHPVLYGMAALGLISLTPVWQAMRGARIKLAACEEACLQNSLLAGRTDINVDEPETLRNSVATLSTEKAKLLVIEERRQGEEQQYQVLEHEFAEAKKLTAGIRRECSALLADLGVQSAEDSFSISFLSRDLNQHAERTAELREAVSSYRARLTEREEILERISVVLKPFGYAACLTTEEAQAHGNALQKRRDLQQKAVELRSRALSGQNETKRAQERLASKFEELYRRANLPSGARSELESRMNMLQEFRETKNEEAAARGTIQHLTEKLRRETPELLERSLLDLDRNAVEAEAALTEYHELRDEVVRIETAIAATRSERSLEVAAESVRAAEEQLREAALENAKSELCSLLLEDIQAEHLQKNRPEVFTRSSQLFSQFTHARYTLSDIAPDKHGASFRVFDAQQGTSLELSQLSSGTKAQILLACKVAFAQSAERGDPIPLFFDEALSTSDPLRFQAVIDALCSLARGGRQILYFTSQPKDTQVIADLCEKQSCSVALHTISKDMERTDASLLISSPLFASVPEPGGLSYEEYVRELNIEPLSLSKGSAAIHLAHLTDDKELLHSLLEMHIQTFGQLKTLYESDSGSVYVPDAAYTRLAARHRLISASFEQWKIGRGEPLTPEIIQEALPKTKHRESILDIWRETRDTIRFLDAIDPNKGKAVSRFKVSQFEQLKDALVERGNFSETPPLSEEEFHRNVLGEVSAEVEAGALSTSEAAKMSHALWEQLSNATLY